MRPRRMADVLLRLINEDALPTRAVPMAAVGFKDCPFGVVLTLPSGACVYVQAAYGGGGLSDYAQPEVVVRGVPLAERYPAGREPLLPGRGLTRVSEVERYLWELLRRGDDGEIAEVEMYHCRAKPKAVFSGLNVTCYSGVVVCLYVLYCFTSERLPYPREERFRRTEVV